MKKLLAILSVVLFANQAIADQVKLETGDVYYCVDIAAFQTKAISGNVVTDNPWGLTKFTLKLTDEYLIMKNAADIVTEMPIIQKTEKDVQVSNKTYVLSLTVHQGKIYYSTASSFKYIASMSTGECDKFP